MNGIRLARNVSAGMVAAIAAWSSSSHMTEVALRFGERAEVAYVLPFSVDGLMVVASVTMVDDKKAGRRPRTSARAALLAGSSRQSGQTSLPRTRIWERGSSQVGRRWRFC